ncbi:MarR family transcriptional regulator [Mycobacterium sp. MBM]|nr:MarR family transcriptional regulator [Mycobacterium sp. MBM]
MNSELAQSICNALLPMSRLIRTAVRADPPLPLLPYAQVEVLRVIQDQPGVSVRGVAQTLQLAPNTVSTLVRALLNADLIEQQPVVGRGRTTTLTLTESAVSMLDVWDDRRAEVVSEVLESLPTGSVEAISRALPALAEFQTALEQRIGAGRG